ncbi:MAG: flavin reductase family protein [Chloroflexota bacterium]|nr:flavin reductase family protein [Chloroflexota bacterium]
MTSFEENLKMSWGKIPTGVSVLTTLENNGDLHGITINSFFSLSIKKPSILVSISKSAVSHDLIANNGRFGLSVLNSDQREYADFFSRNNKEKLPDKFKLIPMNDGIYVIKNSLIQFSCELHSMNSVFDHTLFAANITKVNSNDSSPLVWHKSNFYNL